MNLYDKKPPKFDEIHEILHKQKGVEIAHIVSSSKLKDTLYIQDKDEFVLLLSGKATLKLNGKKKRLKSGEYLFIPALTKHKITKTKKNTHWLAVYIDK